MKLFVRSALVALLGLVLAGCQSTNTPRRLAGTLAANDDNWAASYRASYPEHEPSEPAWDRSMHMEDYGRPLVRRSTIRQMAQRLAPAGANVTELSGLIGKRKQARINCIPDQLTMILNAVSWHYGKHLHIQSGYRSRNHNRSVGGARNSYHLSCQAVDIQVQGVNKYELAKFLKEIPGRGGVGTYCNVSTVHIDVGPKREWHYNCRSRNPARYARVNRRR